MLAGYAFVNTNTATAAALLGWIIVEKIRDGTATTLGAASGAVAGLVAITPAAGFVSPMGSIVVGLAAGAICCLCTTLKFKLEARRLARRRSRSTSSVASSARC